MLICTECKGLGKLVNGNETTAPNAYSFSDKFGQQFGATTGGERTCPSCIGTGTINGFGAS